MSLFQNYRMDLKPNSNDIRVVQSKKDQIFNQAIHQNLRYSDCLNFCISLQDCSTEVINSNRLFVDAIATQWPQDIVFNFFKFQNLSIYK